MAETVHPKLIEYYNPRPFILGVCFCCGVVTGFCIYLFRTPEPTASQLIAPPQPAVATAITPPSEIERRYKDAPTIAKVEESLVGAGNQRLSIESMEIPAPAAVMTTEGGLTGKNARPINQPPRRAPAGQANSIRSPPAIITPPPLPDLTP